METAENKRFIYEFGRFVLDPQDKTLFADGKPLRLPAKEFETLLLLVENNGHALSKEEMMAAVWQNSFVEEVNLAKKISQLRKIFNADGAVNIETLPKHGYRFSAEVNQLFQPDTEAVLETRAENSHVGIEAETVEKTIAMPPLRPRFFTAPRVLAFCLLGLLGGLGVWFWLARTRASKIDSIAVLPLKSLSGEENNKALGLGLADALITKIGGLRQVVVRPISAVTPFADASQDSLEIGRRLNVDAVLEGTILQSEGRTRINVRLLRVADGEQIWADKFDGETAKVFELQDRLTEQTALALRLTLSETITKRETNDAAAYDAYLKGRYFWNQRTEQGLNKAVVFFNQAVGRDPNYARAFSGLADCYILLGIWGAMPPTEAMPRAKESAMKALQKDAALAEAHTSLAFVRWVYDWDSSGADESFRKAIELNPNYATAYHWRAYFLAAAGRFDEAVTHIKKASEIEGAVSPAINADIGEIYCWAREYDKAIAQLQEVLQKEPNFAAARHALGIAYLKKGRTKEALTELEAARQFDNSPRIMSSLGYAYGVASEKEKARKIIGELKKMSQERYVSSFSAAVVHAGLGEMEEAVSLLEDAYKERSDTIAVLNVYPLLDNLRTNPRFVKLVSSGILKQTFGQTTDTPVPTASVP